MYLPPDYFTGRSISVYFFHIHISGTQTTDDARTQTELRYRMTIAKQIQLYEQVIHVKTTQHGKYPFSTAT